MNPVVPRVRPVVALVTDGADAVVVARTAARPALRRSEPLVLAAPLPQGSPPGDLRAVVARVRPAVESLGVPWTAHPAPYPGSPDPDRARTRLLSAVGRLTRQLGASTLVTTDDLTALRWRRPKGLVVVSVERGVVPAEGPWLTPGGRRLLEQRARVLREETLSGLAPLIGDSGRDPLVVEQFERATAELVRLDGLLAEAADLPRRAGGRVVAGDLVHVELSDGQRVRVRLVHPVEAFLDDERISCESPLARALLGAAVGESVLVPAPHGTYAARVLEIAEEPDRDPATA
ncbi:MAG: GreA/GreB family elongation factor [Actinomycetia bacterium]|nr:GreA/GreB family elongation factor [Actinomycetes bacterium]